MSLKSFRPHPLGETKKIKSRYQKSTPDPPKKIKRPPAKYDNPNRDEIINKYLNDGQTAEIPKVQKRKGVHEAK